MGVQTDKLRVHVDVGVAVPEETVGTVGQRPEQRVQLLICSIFAHHDLQEIHPVFHDRIIGRRNLKRIDGFINIEGVIQPNQTLVQQRELLIRQRRKLQPQPHKQGLDVHGTGVRAGAV